VGAWRPSTSLNTPLNLFLLNHFFHNTPNFWHPLHLTPRLRLVLSTLILAPGHLLQACIPQAIHLRRIQMDSLTFRSSSGITLSNLTPRQSVLNLCLVPATASLLAPVQQTLKRSSAELHAQRQSQAGPPIWTSYKYLSQDPLFLWKPGGMLWVHTSMPPSYSVLSNSAGICPSTGTLFLGILNEIYHLRSYHPVMSAPTLVPNYHLVPWSAHLTQSSYLSQSSTIPLPWCQSLDPNSAAPLLIAPNAVQASTPGYHPTSTAVPTGRLLSLPLTPSWAASGEPGFDTPTSVYSCSKSTLHASIGGSFWTPDRSHFLLSDGMGIPTLILCSHLAIAEPPSARNEPVGQSAIPFALKSRLTREHTTLASAASVRRTAPVVKMRPSPTLMTASPWSQSPWHSFNTKRFSTWPTALASLSLKHRVICHHQPSNALLSVFYLTLPLIRFLYHRTRWQRYLPSLSNGLIASPPQNVILPASPGASFLHRESFALEGPSSIGFSPQNVGLLSPQQPSLLIPPFKPTSNGGINLSFQLMGFPSWISSHHAKYPSTPAPMAGTVANQASVVSTMPRASISLAQSQLSSLIGISVISSLSPTSWLLVSGALTGRVFTSAVIPIIRLAFTCSLMGSLVLTCGLGWRVPLPPSNWKESSFGNQLGYLPMTMSSQMHSADLVIQSFGRCSPLPVLGWASTLKKVQFSRICFNLRRALIEGIANLLPAASQFIRQHAWAPNTRASLSSEWRAFYSYCDVANITSLPVDGYQLTLYATWLVASGRIKSADSLAHYVSAVRTLHASMGLPCPSSSQYGPLQQVIRGVRRLAQRPIRKSLPITPPILRNLLNSQPQHPHCGIQSSILSVFRAFSLLLFQTMLRSSNLVPADRSSIDLDMILTWGSIQRTDEGLIISVRKSKTIQFSQRIQKVPLASSPDKAVCPVEALDRLVTLYGPRTCTTWSPVFRLPSSNGSWTPMTKGDFIPFFRSRIKQMGLEPSRYSLHGYRHGGIQECLLAEGNLGLCQLTSDHASNAILAYSEVPPERRMGISARINESLTRHISPAASGRLT
jgi:integrase